MRRELYQGQPHLDLAQSLNDVGVAYRGLGDKENALKGLKLQEQALEMYQGFYKGQLHPNLAISLSNVGLAYKALGQTEKGDEYLRQAKEMREKLNQNPTGEGVENYENVSYWNKYAKEGLEHLLKLRIEAADIKDVVVKGLNLVWSDSLTVTERLCSDISNIVKTEQGTVLLPLNLYGKHWTGLVVGKTADKINIHYMDSEQQPMPTLLKEMLIKALTMTNPKQQINITETELELQRYNNCGPEVIENFMQHLTGHRLSQEDTVPIHALLFEDAIMLVGDC
jgi:tetratricopeptide (TPR) repeat protein